MRTIVELPDVNELMGVNASDGAACHVAHIVHACLHGAQPHRLQALHSQNTMSNTCQIW